MVDLGEIDQGGSFNAVLKMKAAAEQSGQTVSAVILGKRVEFTPGSDVHEFYERFYPRPPTNV